MRRKSKFKLSTSQYILLGFLGVILLGAFLLTLPISSATRNWTSFVDALFTATSATCVTGLVVVPTVTYWSTFGHVVILCLIQIGGLGVVTVMSGMMLMLHQKMGIKDRLLVQDAFNLNSLSGIIRFTKKVIYGTFFVEAVGALLYMTVFIPKFGLRGIWISVFNSISAFCNAGLDIIAEDSLCMFVHNPVINFTTCALIILGGIGFTVWWDVIRVLHLKTKRKIKAFRSLTLHSKIAIVTTMILIFGGALFIFFLEYNNPKTMGDFTLYEKIQASLFQSVTTRTAGFATISQKGLTHASSLICIILMFIGGSPVGTAGGVKTVTVAILLSTVLSCIKNKKETELFHRRVTYEAVKKAVAVFSVGFITVTASILILSMTTSADALDVVFESVSAVATVGLSRDLTPTLSFIGKLDIIATMFFGRIGPLSMAVAFSIKNEDENIIKAPTEDISVG